MAGERSIYYFRAGLAKTCLGSPAGKVSGLARSICYFAALASLHSATQLGARRERHGGATQ
jgi:hypothetical protein